mgnify:CR=1 FL=1
MTQKDDFPTSTTPFMTKRLNLFLDEDLYSRLNETAWTTRISMSEFIRQAISDKLGDSADSYAYGRLKAEKWR